MNDLDVARHALHALHAKDPMIACPNLIPSHALTPESASNHTLAHHRARAIAYACACVTSVSVTTQRERGCPSTWTQCC